MSATTTLRYGLDKSSKEFDCPQCRKKRFVRMMDFETKEYLPDHVGRCNRENDCGYHLTAGEYFKSKGLGYTPAFKQEIEIKPEPTSFLDIDFVSQSMKRCDKNNLIKSFSILFGEAVANKLALLYSIGTSKHRFKHENFPEYISEPGAVIYWQIDKDGMVRTGKIMLYNPEVFKRVKEPFNHVTWMHRILKITKFNLNQCFFGEDLLSKHPDKIVALFESEKSAVTASLFFPDFVCIATGGSSSGCKWRDSDVNKVLKDRKVIMFPDFGFCSGKKGKTCYQEWKERAERIMEVMPCNITISRILEDNLPESERVNGYDLADFLIKRKDGNGLALTDEEYPFLWDAYPQLFKHSVNDFPHLINKILSVPA